MSFKVGDLVKPVEVSFTSLVKGKVYRVTETIGRYIKVDHERSLYDISRFREADPDLETELRLCESRRGILSKRIGEDQEEKKSLEKRIQELQQAIKERDKPKGRVGLKDSLNTLDPMYGISGDGIIFRTGSKRNKREYRAMGNLFYDMESAERAVHDRKQRVLRGEDV